MDKDVNNTRKSCNDLRVNELFLFESFLVLLLASIAFCVISMKIRIIWSSGGATPVNVKLLFLSALIASIFRSIQFLFAFFYYILLFVDRRIVVPFDLNLCIVLQYFYLVPAQVDYCLLFFIAVERMWMTFRLDPVKHSSQSWLYGPTCIIVAWVFSTAQFIYYMSLNGIFAPEPKLVCFCYINVLWPTSALTVNPFAIIGLQVVTCATYVFVYLKNRSKLSQFGINRAQQTLSQRFTIWSNIRTTKWLMPITLLNSLLGCFLMVMVYLGRRIFHEGFTPGYLCYLHLCFIIFCVQDVAVPLLALKYNVTQQNTARDIYPKIFNLSFVKKMFSIDNGHNELHVLNQQNGESKAAAAIGDRKFVNQSQNRMDNDHYFRHTTISDGGVGKTVIFPEKTTAVVKHRPTILNERRKIFDYRVHPEGYHDMLADVWSKR